MKRALNFTMAALLALPLFASDAQQNTKKQDDAAAKKQQAADARQPGDPQPAAAASTDSPLVQAAKRSNRTGKTPSIVITNETLKTSKGHITTTTVQRPVKVEEPKPGPEQAMIERRKVRETEEKKMAARRAATEQRKEAERERRRAMAAEGAEEGLYENVEDDPAQLERAADEAHGAKPPRR